MNRELDVRDVLPAIRVPTLVCTGSGDRIDRARRPLHRRAHPRRAARRAHRQRPPPLVGGRRMRSSTRSSGSSPARGAAAGSTIACSRRCSSPTSSARRSAPRSSAIGVARPARAHHASCGGRSRRFRGREVDTAGDGFFATFDGPARAIRCAAAIGEPCATLGLEIRAGIHTGECELVDGEGRRHRRPHRRAGRRRWPARARCSSRRRSRISSPARASSSPSAARTSSRACRASGSCSPSIESPHEHVSGIRDRADRARVRGLAAVHSDRHVLRRRDAGAARRALLPASSRGAEPRDDARPVPARRRRGCHDPGRRRAADVVLGRRGTERAGTGPGEGGHRADRRAGRHSHARRASSSASSSSTGSSRSSARKCRACPICSRSSSAARTTSCSSRSTSAGRVGREPARGRRSSGRRRRSARSTTVDSWHRSSCLRSHG